MGVKKANLRNVKIDVVQTGNGHEAWIIVGPHSKRVKETFTMRVNAEYEANRILRDIIADGIQHHESMER